MTTNPNHTAFPTYGDAQHLGLTKREWLAGMAMQGLCANPSVSVEPNPIAIDAVCIADALLVCLNKSEPTEK